MINLTLEEFYDYVIRNEQISFTYKDILYSIEPDYEKDTNKSFLNVWLCDQISPTLLVHIEIPTEGYVPKSCIDKALNEKWIIGNKSFMEVVDEIVVTEIG